VVLSFVLPLLTIVPRSKAEESTSDKWEKVFQGSVNDLNGGNYKKAEEGFQNILQQDPENLNAHYYMGLTKYEQQLLPEASDLFKWVEIHAPQMPVVHYYLGLIAYDKQDWDGALQEMVEAERLDPKLSTVEYYLGIIRYKKGDVDRAESAFRSAVHLEPNLSIAHYALAYLLFHDRKDPSGALTETKTGLQRNPDTKLHKKLVFLQAEIQGHERKANIEPSDSSEALTPGPGTPPTPFFAFAGGGPPPFGMIGAMAGPPDAPDFRDRPLFGPGFHGLPPHGLPPDSSLWKKELDLSDSQSSQVATLLKKQMEEVKGLHQKMWKDRETLRDKLKTKAGDVEIGRLGDVLTQDQRKFVDTMQEFESQMRAILTPRQRAQVMLGFSESVWMKPPTGSRDLEIKAENDEGHYMQSPAKSGEVRSPGKEHPSENSKEVISRATPVLSLTP
jgi:tetratricopeptide (TPR) repeat protein